MLENMVIFLKSYITCIKKKKSLLKFENVYASIWQNSFVASKQITYDNGIYVAAAPAIFGLLTRFQARNFERHAK